MPPSPVDASGFRRCARPGEPGKHAPFDGGQSERGPRPPTSSQRPGASAGFQRRNKMIADLIYFGIGLLVGWISYTRLAGSYGRIGGKPRVVAYRKRERTPKPQPPAAQ